MHRDESELDMGRRVLPFCWVIAASVLFFPLLPSSGLRSRQKCMSQRYLVSATGAVSGGWAGRGGSCVASGVLSPWDLCMFRRVIGKGLATSHVWSLPSSLFSASPCPQPGPV